MKIGLQNFQGIGAYTEIPIAPITLFYGQNSAGKSTVADAFEFLSETLSGENEEWRKDLSRHARRNRKDRQLTTGYIGEPEDVVFLVSSYISGQSDTWNFVTRRGYVDPEQFFQINAGLRELFDDAECAVYAGVYAEYRIIFREYDGCWKVQETLLSIDGMPLFKRQLGERVHGYDNILLSFNPYHPRYRRFDEAQWQPSFQIVIKKFFHTELVGLDEHGWITLQTYCHPSHHRDEFSDSPFDWGDVYYEGKFNGTDNVGLEDLFRKVIEMLEFFMVIPAISAARSCSLETVPPIREIPPKHATYQATSSRSNCWEQLASDIRYIKHGCTHKASSWLDFLNEMLGSRDFLNTGYKVSGDMSVSVDIDELNRIFKFNKSERKQAVENLPYVVHPYIVCQPENYHVEIADVGVGISQVIPVLYGCWIIGQCGGVHIQQPELHLHPKLQAQLADVFIKCVNAEDTTGETTYKFSGHFLLESHSEHLLLRILRRIRESHATKSTQAEMPAGSGAVVNLNKIRERHLTADQVSVVYVSKDENGITQLKPLRLNDDGEFLDRWPDGFFTERDRELFGDEDPFA